MNESKKERKIERGENDKKERVNPHSNNNKTKKGGREVGGERENEQKVNEPMRSAIETMKKRYEEGDKKKKERKHLKGERERERERKGKTKMMNEYMLQ